MLQLGVQLPLSESRFGVAQRRINNELRRREGNGNKQPGEGKGKRYSGSGVRSCLQSLTRRNENEGSVSR